MTMRHTLMIAALIAFAALFLLMNCEEISADDSSNGDFMTTNLYLAGSDPYVLWPEFPDETTDTTLTTQVNEGMTQGYVEVGTWESSPLDKDLTVDNDVDVLLRVSSSTDNGPSVQYRVTMFGEQVVSEGGYKSTNTGIIDITFHFSVSDFSIPRDDRVTMLVEVDAENRIDGGDNDVVLHYYSTSSPSGAQFSSDATDIDINIIIKEDGAGVKYYEVLANITDAFEDKHIEYGSFIMNVTKDDDPVNFTWEDRRDAGNQSDHIKYIEATYWADTTDIIEVKYIWYFEGQTYEDETKGLGVEPGDYWFTFEVWDKDGNRRFNEHLREGVQHSSVYVNIHTDVNYIEIVDWNEKKVTEIAAHDSVRVRLYIKVDRGDEHQTYNFAVRLRDDGSEVENQYIQMNGKEYGYVFFDWDPTKGEHTLRLEVDADYQISETDESDNMVERTFNVIAEATPRARISHPRPDSYVNGNVYVFFDGSNSTNPLSGDLEYEWRIYKDDEGVETLSGATAMSDMKYLSSDGSGEYRIKLRVWNDKRENHTWSTFYMNSNPTIDLTSPDDGEIYSAGDDIQFDASDSFDPDGDQLYFTWISTNIDGVINKNGSKVEYSQDKFDKSMSPGVHEMKLELTDYKPTDDPEDFEKKGISILLFEIIVNSPPIIHLSSPVEGASYGAGVPIEFDASGSSDPDGDNFTFKWYDGKRVIPKSESKFTETLSAGAHTIKVVVSDDYSQVEVSVDIMVGNPPTAQTDASKSAELKDGKAKVKLDASASVPSAESNPIVKYLWDLDITVDSDDDGTPDNDVDLETTEPKAELEYTKEGPYTAYLRVVDQSGVQSNPFSISIKIEKESDDDEIPIALIGGGVVILALAGVGGFIAYQKYMLEDDEDDEYDDDYYGDDNYGDDYYGEAEYPEAEYE